MADLAAVMAAVQRNSWVALLSAILLGASSVGCFARNDHELYVDNMTDRSWYVRTDRGMTTPRSWVVRIGPGGRGVTVGWAGPAQHAIELLDEDCQHVGDFVGGEGNVRFVESVPGIAGRVQPFGTSLDRTDDIITTTDCGGWVPM